MLLLPYGFAPVRRLGSVLLRSVNALAVCVSFSDDLVPVELPFCCQVVWCASQWTRMILYAVTSTRVKFWGGYVGGKEAVR